MKTLILIRHAKSDWPEETEDFDRPLAEKGIKDAGKMAVFLKNKNIKIDQFVSSPALRALSTCEIFTKTYDLVVQSDKRLYNPSEANFEAVIADLPDATNSVALFAHNMGISNFANMMSEEIMILPTCGVAGFAIQCNSWSDFENADKKLDFFYEPKTI